MASHLIHAIMREAENCNDVDQMQRPLLFETRKDVFVAILVAWFDAWVARADSVDTCRPVRLWYSERDLRSRGLLVEAKDSLMPVVSVASRCLDQIEGEHELAICERQQHLVLLCGWLVP